MNWFLNYKNGTVTVGSFRLAEAVATDVADIVDANKTGSNECLTASLDIFIKEEAAKNHAVAETCETVEELWDFVLGEGDFLELMLEREFNIALTDYPDLRDLQKQQYEDIAERILNNGE